MSASRPRVLFVGAFPPARNPIFGGMVTSCRALLESTLPERVELDLLDSTQISNPPPSLPVRLVLAMVRCARFVARFERRRPDVVLLFVSVGASVFEKGVMARYARLRGIPVLMFPRGGAIIDQCAVSKTSRWWIASMLRGGTKVLCQSPTWQTFATQVLGFEAHDAPLIRNWTATAKLLAVGAGRTVRRQAPVRLLFVGWLERDKGVFELIEACRLLGASRQFVLDIAGEGRASSEIRSLVNAHGMADRVRFRGWLQEPALLAALQEADVLVLPSWAEGLPNAMIEAMAARLPVVVTRVGSIPDVITDDENGLLVEPRNIESLQRALERVVDDAALRQRLGDEAHGIAAREFGVETAVELLVQEIKSVA